MGVGAVTGVDTGIVDGVVPVVNAGVGVIKLGAA